MSDNKIQLTQSPVIQHDLLTIGAQVTARLDELNLEAQVVTPDTIQTAKNLRTDLRKEHSSYEEQRIAVKNKLNEPYQVFKDLYDIEISLKYKGADEMLGRKISEYEIKLKTERKAELDEYFKELCEASEIDFVKFDQTEIKISAAAAFSVSAMKKKCSKFIDQIKDDLRLIETQPYKVEILAEYKKTLNASGAIQSITERKEREKIERENRRKSQITALGLKFEEMTSAYLHNEQPDSIFIEWDEVKNFTDEAFSNHLNAVKKKIVEYNKSKEQQQAKKATVSAPSPATAPVSKPASAPAPSSAPVAEAKKTEPAAEKQPEKTYQAIFQVKGTRKELEALKKYLIDNELKYKNIKKENVKFD